MSHLKKYLKMCLAALLWFGCTPDSAMEVERDLIATIVATSDGPEELAYGLQEAGFIKFAEPRMNPADNDDINQAPPPCPGGGLVTDNDGDGWTTGCGRQGGDCDDTNATINPGAVDECTGDGVDNDCNGDGTTADPAIVDKDWLGVDLDNDNKADPRTAFSACSVTFASPTLVEIVNLPAWKDCNDSSAIIAPLMVESANGIDDNCDPRSTIDDHIGLIACFADSDGDNYGAGAAQWVSTAYCPGGFVRNPLDCDDTDRAFNPRAREECDGDDNDCDGAIDNSQVPTWLQTWYTDVDGDGWGVGAPHTTGTWYSVCKQELIQRTWRYGDANDFDASVH